MGSSTPRGRIPLALKLFCTAWAAVLVPVYWSVYGPTNFLYFCDVALFMTVVGLWKEDKLWLSMPAVGLIIPQLVWCADVAFEAAGFHLIGMTTYMFDPQVPLVTRLLSLFHGWLPFVLLYGVWRLGYDKRGLLGWTALAWLLVGVCYMFIPAPPAPSGSNLPVNVNFVYGVSKDGPQTWMNETAYVLLYGAVLLIAFFIPTHLGLKRFFHRATT